ncbi:MAG: DUF2812 domain-containing protein [Anaerostipes sp.]|uniref:DUF2812 domain-containing protein n=1 Tax=Anaerostipes sp. 992a TaxID=1261637 RepID=UPI000951102D|nr:DUF2812 domain-containing protein [Anaerostipes sp. 992a]MCI5951416.1 DUF2812 domain-containing protein [Anaerostipes sp.]MDD5970001.1 DUF2812 domain-containing protein [Anaerostipes sp.]OLR65982.1 hypothetical protein BHF69_00860 [Anaerostipes sp. 992a]
MSKVKKENRTEFRWFSISEYEKEEEYLSKQHGMGWKLTGITFPGFYHFTKCQPEEVRYQLDYNQEGISNKDEYVKMFQDCGWEYLMDFVGYSYFRKSCAQMSDKDEGIFCDEESKLDMLIRVAKGRMLPLVIIFFCIIIPQIIFQFVSEGGFHRPVLISYIVLFIVYIGIFLHFGMEYWKLKKKIER